MPDSRLLMAGYTWGQIPSICWYKGLLKLHYVVFVQSLFVKLLNYMLNDMDEKRGIGKAQTRYKSSDSSSIMLSYPKYLHSKSARTPRLSKLPPRQLVGLIPFSSHSSSCLSFFSFISSMASWSCGEMFCFLSFDLRPRPGREKSGGGLEEGWLCSVAVKS